ARRPPARRPPRDVPGPSRGLLAPGDPERSRTPTRPVRWCWTTVRRGAGFSTTTRADRCIRRGYGWPRPWGRGGSRSSATWTRRKGARGEAVAPAPGMHRPGADCGRGRPTADPGACPGGEAGGGDAGPEHGQQPPAEAAVPAVAATAEQEWRSGPGADGGSDGVVPGRAVRRS